LANGVWKRKKDGQAHDSNYPELSVPTGIFAFVHLSAFIKSNRVYPGIFKSVPVFPETDMHLFFENP
jgi:hypothetical protein